MSSWSVLGRGADPVPGDPSQVRELAGRLRQQAELVERATGRLRSVAANGGDLRMEGAYAPRFTAVLGELPGEMAKLGVAYRGCGSALSAYAVSLDEAKAKAGAALRRGTDSDYQYQGAVREIRALLPPDRQVALSSGLGLNETVLDATTTGLDEGIRAQVRAAARRARYAAADRDVARRLADDAAKLRGDAEARCESAIRQVLDNSGIRNRPWYQKARDAVSAPFRSWDDFVSLCKNVALAAGVVALFVSGPIGLALMAAALIAGAVVFGNTLARFSRGQAGVGDVLLDGMGLIPGGRGVLNLGRLGRGAADLARVAAWGEGGRLVGAGLRIGRNVATSVPHGIRVAIDEHPRYFARAVKCRFVGRDPVDMATGEMILQQTDFELPGVLPFALSRTHASSYRAGRWFGPSWSSVLDQRLEVDADGVCYAAPDAVLLAYPHPAPGRTVLPAEGPRLALSASDLGGYRVDDTETGWTLHFPALPDGELTGTLSVAAISDRNGNRIEFDYDSEGVLSTIRHSGGYHLDVASEHGLITGIGLRGSAGEQGTELVRYEYDAASRLIGIVNSSDRALRFDYDAEGRMTRWEDRNGTWYRYTYDARGRVVRTSGSDGCLDGVMSYDDERRTTVEVNSLGQATTYHFNEGLQMERVVDPLGRTTVHEWDRYDWKLAETDPLGRTTRWTYDEAGDVAAITRPDGGVLSIGRNAARLPVSLTEPDGARWRWDYDERGNPTTVTDPAGAVTTTAHGDNGHLLSVTDALGNTRWVRTDAAGLPIAVTDPTGAITRAERDGLGRVVALTDPLGATTRLEWTVEGRLAARTAPDGATERWAYDGEGNLVEHVDALGQPTRLEVTHFDLPAARTGPDGARLAFSYDTELRLTAVTDPLGRPWTYTYDAGGSLVREADFDGRVLDYDYDPAGQLVGRTVGGETTLFVRDVLGNVVERRTAAAVSSFDYDLAGRLVGATGPDAALALVRDPLGRVLSETCNGRTVTSEYDALGRRVRRLTPSGAESHWDYDANDRPSSLSTAGQVLTFGHDAAGREVERRIGAGAALTQTWDAASRLLSQTVSAAGAVPATAAGARLMHRRSFSYRADGHLIGIDDSRTGRRQLELDPVGQVTAVDGPGWTERYAYNAAGNVTDASWPGSDDGAATGARELVGTRVGRAGSVRFEHDTRGRVVLRQQSRLSSGPRTWRYGWDTDDRLVSVSTPDGQQWRYRYDPLGRRIAKQRVSGNAVLEEVEFSWDGDVLAEQSTGSVLTTWDWNGYRAVGQTSRDLSQQEVDARFHTIVTDLVGTPTELVGADGMIAWQARTTLWGAPQDAPPSSVDCPLRFPGQYHDPETGLHQNVFRYYDPATATYTSPDPLGLAAGLNPTTYVPNPLHWLDPLGLAPYALFSNQMDGSLGRELARARALGIHPAIAGSPLFDEFIGAGRIKWAVLQDGTLATVPKFVSGHQISHAVISGGADVRAAGEADIAGTAGQYFGLDITNHSGHFLPSDASLDVGKSAFRSVGIYFR